MRIFFEDFEYISGVVPTIDREDDSSVVVLKKYFLKCDKCIPRVIRPERNTKWANFTDNTTPEGIVEVDE